MFRCAVPWEVPGLVLLQNLESSHEMGLPISQLVNLSLSRHGPWGDEAQHDGMEQRSCLLEAPAQAVSHLVDQCRTLGKCLLCWCLRWCLPS